MQTNNFFKVNISNIPIRLTYIPGWILIAFFVLAVNSDLIFSANLTGYYPTDSGNYWKYNFTWHKGDRGGSISDSGIIEKQIIEASQSKLTVRNIVNIAISRYSGFGYDDSTGPLQPETTYTNFSKIDSFWILDTNGMFKFSRYTPNDMGVIDSLNLNWEVRSDCDTLNYCGSTPYYCLSPSAPDTVLLLGRDCEKYHFSAGVGLIQFYKFIPALESSYNILMTLLEFRTGESSVESNTLQCSYSNKINCTPNPFNLSTKIAFDMSSSGMAKVSVYSINGETIRNLSNGFLSAGRHQMVWNGKTNNGLRAAPGTYVIRVQMKDVNQKKIVTVIR